MERRLKQLERDSIGVERSNHASTSHPKGTNRSSGGTKCPPQTTLCAAVRTVRASAPEGIGRRRRALGRCLRGSQRSTRPGKRLPLKPITPVFSSFPQALDADARGGPSQPSQEGRASRQRGAPCRSASAGNRHPRADRPQPDRAAGGAAMPRQGPRRPRPRKQKTRGPQKEWPRVFACIAWRRFPKKPRPRVGGTGFEPVTSTV